jgi:hypothetical protein
LNTVRVKGSQGYVILTFDDSDVQRSNERALSIMDSYGYKGVAFATIIWTDPRARN